MIASISLWQFILIQILLVGGLYFGLKALKRIKLETGKRFTDEYVKYKEYKTAHYSLGTFIALNYLYYFLSTVYDLYKTGSSDLLPTYIVSTIILGLIYLFFSVYIQYVRNK